MASHTNYLNKKAEFEDPNDVTKWLIKNLDLKNVGITCQLNYDYTIRRLEINKKLTKADKEKLHAKFPELENKEVEE